MRNWSWRAAKLKKWARWTDHETVQPGLACPSKPRYMSAGRSPRSLYWTSLCFFLYMQHSPWVMQQPSTGTSVLCGWRLQRSSDNSCSLVRLTGALTVFASLGEGEGTSVFWCSTHLQCQVPSDQTSYSTRTVIRLWWSSLDNPWWLPEVVSLCLHCQ